MEEVGETVEVEGGRKSERYCRRGGKRKSGRRGQVKEKEEGRGKEGGSGRSRRKKRE